MSALALNNSDKKYWGPVPQVVDFLANRLPINAKVLEIGPGYVKFPRATKFVDFVDVPNVTADRFVKLDMCRDPLPFADKSFDFVYCRHVLEDTYNPFLICREMERVGKAGYLETPSAIAEMCRGIDGSSPPYRGYNHHKWVVWVHEGQLRFVSKFPFVEYIGFDEHRIRQLLRDGPKYWNTHYLWEGRIEAVHRQCPMDYAMPDEYAPLLNAAMEQAKIACDAFWQQISEPLTVAAMPQAFGKASTG